MIMTTYRAEHRVHEVGFSKEDLLGRTLTLASQLTPRKYEAKGHLYGKAQPPSPGVLYDGGAR